MINNSPLNSASENGRISYLDGMRGFGILAVLYYHFCLPHSEMLHKALRLGPTVTFFTVMDMFFVISGFLIGGILLDNKKSSNYYHVFYVRRILRIFPLYYGLIFIYAVIAVLKLYHPLHVSWMFKDPLPFAPFLCYLQNFWMLIRNSGRLGAPFLSPTWSLSVEEQFYFITPFLIKRTGKALPWVLTGLILTAPAVRTFLFLKITHSYHENAGVAAALLPSRWDGFFLGILGALWVRNENISLYFKRHRKLFISLFMALVSGALYLIYLEAHPWSRPMLFWGHTWMSCFYLFLILMFEWYPEGTLQKILSQKWLCFAGMRSYFIYLFHVPVLGFVNSVFFKFDGRMPVDTPEGFCAVILSVGIVFLLSMISWDFLEAPLIRFGKKLKYEKTYAV